jgi:hypothetical protein
LTPPKDKDFNTTYSVSSGFKAEDDTVVRMINKRIDEVNGNKAAKDFVIAEIEHLKSDISRVDEQSLIPHECDQSGVIETMQQQLRDNTDSIKKVYTWQATVGISLLFFFLTVGVAALRFVDKIDFATQDHAARLDKLELTVHELSVKKNPPADDLKKLIKDAIDEANNNSLDNSTE